MPALRAIPGSRATPVEKLMLVAEILGVYVKTRWRMPRGDIRQITTGSQDLLRRGPAEPAIAGRDDWPLAAHLGHAVFRTLRALPTDSRCLVQSLVLSQMLSARGIPSTLVIGAHTRPEFKAHAWVEHDGRPVLPPRDFQDGRLVEL
jgi:hypothetical protein